MTTTLPNDMTNILARCAEADEERRVRNRERDFAEGCGWGGERYWETADWHELRSLQNEGR
jgi:hypothetical protein